MTAPIVALLTDFGLTDHYVGAMKGALLRVCPDVTLVDITHLIPPQDVGRAAYELSSAYRSFPASTIFLTVVDPGVGTERKPIIFETPDYRFVGPDNGIFSSIAAEQGEQPLGNLIRMPGSCSGWEIDPGRVATGSISNTFHGRDIFAPAAGKLAAGAAPSELGEPIRQIAGLSGSGLQHRIIAVDHFGNLITSYRPGPNETIELSIAGSTLSGPVRTYGDSSGLILLTSSSGYLEIAEVNGDAAKALGSAPGDEVQVRAIHSNGEPT